MTELVLSNVILYLFSHEIFRSKIAIKFYLSPDLSVVTPHHFWFYPERPNFQNNGKT